jgi:hypothetical protein
MPYQLSINERRKVEKLILLTGHVVGESSMHPNLQLPHGGFVYRYSLPIQPNIRIYSMQVDALLCMALVKPLDEHVVTLSCLPEDSSNVVVKGGVNMEDGVTPPGRHVPQFSPGSRLCLLGRSFSNLFYNSNNFF